MVSFNSIRCSPVFSIYVTLFFFSVSLFCCQNLKSLAAILIKPATAVKVFSQLCSLFFFCDQRKMLFLYNLVNFKFLHHSWTSSIWNTASHCLLMSRWIGTDYWKILDDLKGTEWRVFFFFQFAFYHKMHLKCVVSWHNVQLFHDDLKICIAYKGGKKENLPSIGMFELLSGIKYFHLSK